MAIGKRTKATREGVDPAKAYPLAEAVKMVKERAKAKFDETIEIAMNLGVDPKHADQMVRGVVTLPNGTGRSVRVGVFARGPKADEAKAAGADVVGAEDLVEKVNAGQIDFDRCIATPDMMGLVGRLGKVLGPRGLMPNPRVGTVTMDVANAVKGAKGGSVEFRVEIAGILQAGVGKASFSEDKLVENIKAFADAVNKAKPAGAKGHYINRVSISSTMGPGVKVDMATLGVTRRRQLAALSSDLLMLDDVPGGNVRDVFSRLLRLDPGVADDLRPGARCRRRSAWPNSSGEVTNTSVACGATMRTMSGLRVALMNSSLSRVTIGARRAGRRHHAVPHLEVEAGIAGLGHGRHVGRGVDALRSADGDDAKLAGLGLLADRDIGAEQEIEPPGHDVGGGGRRAPVRHVHDRRADAGS